MNTSNLHESVLSEPCLYVWSCDMGRGSRLKLCQTVPVQSVQGSAVSAAATFGQSFCCCVAWKLEAHYQSGHPQTVVSRFLVFALLSWLFHLCAFLCFFPRAFAVVLLFVFKVGCGFFNPSYFLLPPGLFFFSFPFLLKKTTKSSTKSTPVVPASFRSHSIARTFGFFIARTTSITFIQTQKCLFAVVPPRLVSTCSSLDISADQTLGQE